MGFPTIVSTPMHEEANSYCDAAYADTYWANDYRATLSAQWAALTTPQKSGALIDACKIIETVRFTLPTNMRDYALFYDRRSLMVRIVDRERQPFKFYYSQKLQFPRNLDIWVLNPSVIGNDGSITPDESQSGQPYIPQDVMDAQCEQAAYLLNFDESIYANRLQGVTMDTVGVGKGAVTTTQEYSGTPSMIAPRALEKLRPYMVWGGKQLRS